MFFYRYIPRNTHLHEYESAMQVRFLFGRCKRVECDSKRYEVYKFYERCDGDWIYFVVDPKLAHKIKPVMESKKPNPSIPGFAALSKIPRWIAKEVGILYVNPDFRGRGISTLLYDAILRDGVILVSGKMQNIGARKLWIRLIENPKYVVWAQDLLNLKRKALVEVNEDEIECSLKLYRDLKLRRRKQTEDIRMIACYGN